MTELWLRIAMTSYYPNSASKIGVGWVAQRLANAIVERGHSVTMFSVLGSRFSVLAVRDPKSTPLAVALAASSLPPGDALHDRWKTRPARPL